MEGRSQEDLALIRRMMEESRGEVVDRGKHFLLWGLISAAGCLATWLYFSGAAVPAPQWVWTGLLVVGWAASMVVGYRDDRSARVRSLGSRMLSLVWIAAAITLTLIAVGGMFGSVVPAAALSGLVAVVIAAPIAATAGLTGERWLYLVAIGWWSGGGVLLFVPGRYGLLVLSAMALLLLAVPGAVLYARSRSGAASAEAVVNGA